MTARDHATEAARKGGLSAVPTAIDLAAARARLRPPTFDDVLRDIAAECAESEKRLRVIEAAIRGRAR